MKIAILASVFASIVIVVAACSSSEESAPSRAVTPAPVGAADAGTADAAVCFEGDPQALEDYLNACTEGQCAPFDNARAPLYEPGKPLPPVP